jgi:hypothetical protein
MSDYLWDKTGDGDAEVERLEELLGAFSHQPRALDLRRAAAPPQAFLRQPRRFRPALLVAATLLLMLLAGALVLLRQRGTNYVQQATSSDSEVAPRQEFATPRAPSKPEELANSNVAPEEKPKQPAFQAATLNERRQESSSIRRRADLKGQPRRAAITQATRDSLNAEALAPPRVEQQAAKEQLVYALRLASAKLNEVQKMTRGAESPRHAHNERNRTR